MQFYLTNGSVYTDQSLQELRQKLQQWSALQKEIKSPVQESQLYRKAVDLIER